MQKLPKKKELNLNYFQLDKKNLNQFLAIVFYHNRRLSLQFLRSLFIFTSGFLIIFISVFNIDS